MLNRPTRYRIFDAKSQRPLPEGDDKKAPDIDRTDTNAVNDNLKNVDQNDGGYGRGSGFVNQDDPKLTDQE